MKHVKNGAGGVLLKTSGSAAEKNRVHEFVHFADMSEEKVRELRLLVKRIGGHPLNRERAITRTVVACEDEEVRDSVFTKYVHIQLYVRYVHFPYSNAFVTFANSKSCLFIRLCRSIEGKLSIEHSRVK